MKNEEKLKLRNNNREKPERIRTSAEEKYEFLVSMIGKDEEELKQARMYTGLTYADARDDIQYNYNKGRLNLSPEQIDILKQNGILHLSAQEREQLSNQYNFSQGDIADILKEYSSIEEFIRKFKNGEVDYRFKSDIFVGERILIASKNPMTVKQKKVICSLAKDLFNSDFNKSYIDADELMDSFRTLDDRKRRILTLKYGLNGEEPVNSKKIGELFKITSSRVGQLEANALNEIRSRYGKILIQEDDASEINKQLKEIQIQEDGIAKLEEILILLYENDSIEAENLKLSFSEDQIEYLQQHYGFSELKTGTSVLNLREDLEHRLSNYYYYALNEDISKRKTLEAKIERNKKVIEIYNKLKERYLKDEDIFDPECIIPGIEIEHVMPVEDIQPDQIESISSLGISINLLTYLHHFGLETIQDVKDLSENDEKMSELLNKVQDENTRNNLRKVIENVKMEYREKNSSSYCTLFDLGFCVSTYNSLARVGIQYVGDILKCYDAEKGNFKPLLKIKGIGVKAYKEILDALEKLGFIDENGQLIEISKDNEQQQNNETIGDMSKFTLDIANAARRRVNARAKAKKAKELLQEYEEKSLFGKHEEESSLET